MRVVLLAPWLGEPPAWLDKFRERMAWHRDLIDFRFMPAPWENLRARIHETTGIEPPAKIEPRKLCDYRPAFGLIFAREIGDADYWGWCDIDCVFGDFERFIVQPLEAGANLLTDNAAIVNGPLTIVANTIPVSELYRSNDEYRRVFSKRRHVAFDERGFSDIVRANPLSVACHLVDVHTSNNDEPPPIVEGKKLFSAKDGRELLTYHFPKGPKRWPL